MKFHPLYAGRFAMGLEELGADAPGIIATQSTHKQLGELLAGLADPHQGPPYPRPEAPRRASALQRELHAARLDLAVLSAVRLARRRRADDEGRSGEVLWDDTIRLGIELRKKMRAVRREFEEKETRSRAPLVLRAVRARPRAIPDVSREAPCTMSPGRASAPTSSRPTPLLAARAGRRLARLRRPCRRAGFAMTDPNKLTLLTPGFDRDRRLCRTRHSGAGRGAISAREPHRAGEERPQLAAVPADARRRGQQGRHPDQRARRLQETA
jgi:ornithine decarboxylase